MFQTKGGGQEEESLWGGGYDRDVKKKKGRKERRISTRRPRRKKKTKKGGVKGATAEKRPGKKKIRQCRTRSQPEREGDQSTVEHEGCQNKLNVVTSNGAGGEGGCFTETR